MSKDKNSLFYLKGEDLDNYNTTFLAEWKKTGKFPGDPYKPIKDNIKEDFRTGGHWKMYYEFHNDDYEKYKGIFISGNMRLHQLANGNAGERRIAQIIDYNWTHTKVCLYDVYPNKFSSIDIDWRLKTWNPEQNLQFNRVREFSDIYNMLLNCNIHYLNDAELWNQDAPLLEGCDSKEAFAEEMLYLFNAYKPMDIVNLVERAAANKLIPEHLLQD